MKGLRKHRPSPGTAFGFAALLIALGGVAFAAIPDSNGTIHGCFKKNGNLRVVDSSSECRANETAIQWSQQAPTDVIALGDLRLAVGESRDLVAKGPLTLTARCRNFAPNPSTPNLRFDEADVLVSTTVDHAAFGSESAGTNFGSTVRGKPSGNGDLRTTTPDDQRLLASVPTRTDISNKASYMSVHFAASAPDGTHLTGELDAAVDALGSTGCVFGGHGVATP